MAENGGVYEMSWFVKRLCSALSAEGELPLVMVMWRRAAVGKERVGAARPHSRSVRTCWASSQRRKPKPLPSVGMRGRRAVLSVPLLLLLLPVLLHGRAVVGPRHPHSHAQMRRASLCAEVRRAAQHAVVGGQVRLL